MRSPALAHFLPEGDCFLKPALDFQSDAETETVVSGFAESGFVRNAELFTGLCNGQAVGKRCGVVVLVC